MAPRGTRRIEFLLAYEDRTWDTVVCDVPLGWLDNESWAHENLASMTRYRKVVFFAVYSTTPD